MGKGDSATGFAYAVSRVLKGMAKIVEDYNEDMTGINIKCAATDDNDCIAQDARGETMFTKEGSIRRNKLARDLRDKEVAAPFYISDSFPSDLTPFQVDAFEGFVIADRKEPVQELKRE